MAENKCLNYGYWGGTKNIEIKTEEKWIRGYEQRIINRCALDGKRCPVTKTRQCQGYEEV